MTKVFDCANIIHLPFPFLLLSFFFWGGGGVKKETSVDEARYSSLGNTYDANWRPRTMAVNDGNLYCTDGVCYTSWWHSKTGTIVRWVLFFAIFGTITLYVLVGYLHAKRRLRKGLRPLAYHRCLVSRRSYGPPVNQHWPNGQPFRVYCYQQPQQSGYYQPAYPMNDMPLPAYDPNRPPVYSGPPEGGSKVDPSQNTTPGNRGPESNPAPTYAPPQGPPPNR